MQKPVETHSVIVSGTVSVSALWVVLKGIAENIHVEKNVLDAAMIYDATMQYFTLKMSHEIEKR